MTIRNKLILSSAAMLIFISSIGLVSIWSISRWQTAAEIVEIDRSRTLLVDQIRAEMNRQVNYGINYLSGGPAELESFWDTEKILSVKLLALKEISVRPEEKDHIQDFEESLFELSHLVKKILERTEITSSEENTSESKERLREMSDEIADDVSVLHQYYRRQVDESVAKATSAGRTAGWVIGLGLLIAIAQVLAMIFVSQRWLVKPIALVGEATNRISHGDFETRLDIKNSDEWGDLAQSVNNMALALSNLQRELQTKERLAAVGEIAAYTAHNIRNPLAGIRAAAQVAIIDIGEKDSSTKETLEDIIKSVDRLESWIKSLMNFAAPVNLEENRCSISKLIIEVVDLLTEKSKQDNVELVTAITANIPEVIIDYDLFGQALANIITNAIESGTNKVEIGAAFNDKQGNRPEILIFIKDYGKGIDPEIEPKLFHAFTTNKSGGTGLGLAQAKKIVELHKGKLSIDSKVGDGTRINITLYLDKSDYES